MCAKSLIVIVVPYKDASNAILDCHKPKIKGNKCYDICCCPCKKREENLTIREGGIDRVYIHINIDIYNFM